MKPGTTRGFCETWPPQRGSSPDVAFGALSGKADSNEKKNEGLFIGSRVLLRTNGRDETLAGLYPLIVPNPSQSLAPANPRVGRDSSKWPRLPCFRVRQPSRTCANAGYLPLR